MEVLQLVRHRGLSSQRLTADVIMGYAYREHF